MVKKVKSTPARRKRAKQEKQAAYEEWERLKAEALRELEEAQERKTARERAEAREAVAEAEEAKEHYEEARTVARRAETGEWGHATDEGPPWGPGPYYEEMAHVLAAMETLTERPDIVTTWRQGARLMNFAKLAKKQGEIDKAELQRTKKVFKELEELYKQKRSDAELATGQTYHEDMERLVGDIADAHDADHLEGLRSEAMGLMHVVEDARASGKIGKWSLKIIRNTHKAAEKNYYRRRDELA